MPHLRIGLLLCILAAIPAYAQQDDLDDAAARAAWFRNQRAYPFARIPAGVRLKAIQQLDRMIEAEKQALRNQRVSTVDLRTTPETAINTNWTSIGPQPTTFSSAILSSGRVEALATDPRNALVVYAGGAEGGVWKTTDGGSTWTPLTDTQAALAISAIVVDPTNPDVIYAGTGDPAPDYDGYSGAGILKSTDAGATWTNLPGLFSGGRIESLLVNPGNGQILLLGTNGVGTTAAGIYRSTDAGKTWSIVLKGSAAPHGLQADPRNTGLMYAAMGLGVFKSTDGGATWTAANGSGSAALPIATSGGIALAMAPSNPSILYVSTTSPDTASLGGMYRTQDGGSSWQLLPQPADYCTHQCWHNNALSVSPSNPNVIYAGGVTMVRSTDGGQTWSNAFVNPDNQNVGVHSDQHQMAWSSSGTMFLANDGGVWSSADANGTSVHWTNLNSSLGLTQFSPGFAIHPTNVNVTIGGAQDNGVQLFVGSTSWKLTRGGDGGWAAIDFLNPNNAYITLNAPNGVLKSLDGGASWNASNSGVALGDSSIFITPLVMDPGNAQRLYLGYSSLYQTNDGAATWQKITTGATGNVTSIGVSPVDSNAMFVGTDTGQIKGTVNAASGTTSTWTDRSAGLPKRYPTQVVPDPSSATTVYVTFSGFGSGHIFMSTDRGATWTDASGNLPDVPVNDLVVDPDIAGTLYAATDIGVFYTRDAVNWIPMGTNLPRVAVTGLKLHRPSRTLRASTHGRGMWDVLVPLTGNNPAPAVTSLVPPLISPGLASAVLTVMGTGFSPTSDVRLNGIDRASTFISPTQLRVSLTAADLATAGSADVAVYSPLPGGGISNSALLVINSSYPTPAVTRLTPASAVPGSGDQVLTVSGSNFVPASVVRWNGKDRVTTMVSSSVLTAPVFAADLASPGRPTITVFTPTPGGGESAPVAFRVGSGVATLATVSDSEGVAIDPLGNVFYSDSNKNQVQKISGNGSTTLFAGAGLGCGGDGGLATSSTMNFPTNLAFDYSGNLYIADTRCQHIRRVGVDGVIRLVASSNAGSFPDSLAVDFAGNVYYADLVCHLNKITPDGKTSAVKSIATCPGFVAIDTKGNLYIVDAGSRIVQLSTDGTSAYIAGLPASAAGSVAAGDGVAASSAQFPSIRGLAVDAAGNIFVGVSGGVYQFAIGGMLHSVITDSKLQPYQMLFDQRGTLYIADASGRVLSLQSAGAAATSAPVAPQGGIVNGASFNKDGVVAPWSLVSLFGAGLASANGGAASVPLPLGIGGTQVYVGNTLAPLVFVSPGQINFQVPVEATGTSAAITVSLQGVHSIATTLTLAPATPGIFTADTSGGGQGAVLNQDFSANSSANPAATNSVIQIFATGLGATNPPVKSGQAANASDPFNLTASTPVVLINGTSASVQFSAGAPGFVGLYQVNAVIPAGTSPGNATLQIQIGGRSSNVVTVAVK